MTSTRHSDRNGSSRLWVLALGSMIVTASAFSVEACDVLVGKLLAKAMRPVVAGLGCGDLANIGLDVADHTLGDVCYVSDAQASKIGMTAHLRCSTGSGALFSSTVSETITAHATIDGVACVVTEVHVDAGGQLAKLVLSALNAEGAARSALQETIDKVCEPQ